MPGPEISVFSTGEHGIFSTNREFIDFSVRRLADVNGLPQGETFSAIIIDDKNHNLKLDDFKTLLRSHLIIYRLADPFNEAGFGTLLKFFEEKLKLFKKLKDEKGDKLSDEEFERWTVSKLWNEENLLVIVDIESLRDGLRRSLENTLHQLRPEVRSEVQRILGSSDGPISYRLSWDATISDTLRLRDFSHVIDQLYEIPHLAIRFGFEAVLYRDRDSSSTPLLVFEPQVQEDEYVQRGLADDPELKFIAGMASSVTLTHWYSARVGEMAKAMTKGLEWTRSNRALTVLRTVEIRTEDLDKAYLSTSRDDLPQTARDIVTKGVNTVKKKLETAKFGTLVTADRKEMEGFRRIASQVEKYLNGGSTSRPLSFAVFGQPGAGKSFGVKQVIKEILTKEGKDMQTYEFNLSQFSRDADLKAAFEKVRWSNLSGKTPIVFFDEFDCTFGKKMGWLEYFVDPMDLGGYWTQTFSDGRANDPEFRPLGGGIFIFVGGTCRTWDEFKGDLKVNYNYHQFDLSQFKGYSDLVKKFSILQTVKLSGKLPVALFQNYNCKLGEKNLGWLQYFLAPMQDGEFLDEYGAPQPLTPGIFFFQEAQLERDPEVTDEQQKALEKAAKKPDFESRLRGYIHSPEDVSHVKETLRNYLQPSNKRGQARPLSIGVSANTDFTLDKIIELVNGVLDEIKRARQDTLPSNVLDSNVPLPTSIKRKWEACVKGTVDIAGPNPIASDDKMYQIRRAILLRAQLQQRLGRQHDESIAMDEGFLDAFLDTKEFRHGARSIEVILDMSKLPEKLPDRYNIPAEIFPAKTQLELQVDASEFLGHVCDTASTVYLVNISAATNIYQAKVLGGKKFQMTTRGTPGEEVTLKFR